MKIVKRCILQGNTKSINVELHIGKNKKVSIVKIKYPRVPSPLPWWGFCRQKWWWMIKIVSSFRIAITQKNESVSQFVFYYYFDKIAGRTVQYKYDYTTKPTFKEVMEKQRREDEKEDQ
jgi:hypothetical protein